MASVTENKKPLNDLINFKCYSCIKKEANQQGLYHCEVRNGFYFLELKDECTFFSDDAEAWLKTLTDIRAYNFSHSGHTFGTNVRQLNREIQQATKAVETILSKDIRQIMKEESRRGKKGGGGVDPVGKAAEGCRLNDNRYKMVWGDDS